MMVVSHDYDFLEAIATDIVHLVEQQMHYFHVRVLPKLCRYIGIHAIDMAAHVHAGWLSRVPEA